MLTALLHIACFFSVYSKSLTIALAPHSSKIEQLAAKELQRYGYLLTGNLPVIDSVGKSAELDYCIQLERDSLLGMQDYRFVAASGRGLAIFGGSELGILYGVYDFLETQGVGFTLNGDILPDKRLNTLDWTGINTRVHHPAFALRGVQPFHDFPEGPDWWNQDDYLQIMTQLAKMRMNFFGLHSYPEGHPQYMYPRGGYNAEPGVWVGTKDHIGGQGRVTTVSPVGHFSTGDSAWGYNPVKTADFSFGAAQLFETDVYGADYMKNRSSWPHTPAENVEIVNSVGALFSHVFGFAGRLGIKTGLGTETPLRIPADVRSELQSKGIDPTSDSAKRVVYEGIFSRIKETHPLDYYWLWTPEGWRGDEDVDRTKRDLSIAIAAAKDVHANFKLGTCGWSLGPEKDPAAFDWILPKQMPMATINRRIGYFPVQSAFAEIKQRPLWEIAWLEDDNALITPQFWVGRVLKDAADAYRYGCNGMMGIHWRTENLSPAFYALSRVGWETDGKDHAADDIYRDWAVREFGADAAARMAAIFNGLDGVPSEFSPGDGYEPGALLAKFFRSSYWAHGPGGFIVNRESWEQIAKQYGFIGSFEQLAYLMTSEPLKERYAYWLNTFLFARAQAHIGCLLGVMEGLVEKLDSSKDRSALIGEFVRLRNESLEEWKKMMTYFLQTVNSTGAMGTIANLEQHNLAYLHVLTRYDSVVNKYSAMRLKPLIFSKVYGGPTRMIVTTRRSVLESGEDLCFKVRLLSYDGAATPVIYYKPLGGEYYARKELQLVARGVYQLRLTPAEYRKGSFEYYIISHTKKSLMRYPNGVSNQTVVVW